MAIYAIGDVQGCYTELVALIDKLDFDARHDQLWFVGDLVNRGAESLQVLRLVKSLGDSAVTVLGNHDLHLLAIAQGHAKPHPSDTLDEILAADDKDELLDWLRNQRMLHAEHGHVLVHAGLLPSWTVAQACELAAEVEAELRGKHYDKFFAHMYGNQPDAWDDELDGYKRLRVITNALTRMRVCTPEGAMEFKFKGEQHKIPAGYIPWFDVPHRASRSTSVIFGHWSALGLLRRDDIIALDTGCLWGGPLTAIRLEDKRVFQVPSANPIKAPHS